MKFAKVDINTDEGRDIAHKYGINGVPAFVVLDGSGRVIYRKVGGKPDVAFVERLAPPK